MPYVPENTPSDPQLLPNFLRRELQRLSDELHRGVEDILLPTKHTAPERPREGMIVKADGTDWNPGSGAGIYAYVGGAWVKL